MPSMQVALLSMQLLSQVLQKLKGISSARQSRVRPYFRRNMALRVIPGRGFMNAISPSPVCPRRERFVAHALSAGFSRAVLWVTTAFVRNDL